MTPIPFEPQLSIDRGRTCGAAALTMVYRSLGLTCRQRSVWQRIAEEVRPGVRAARTHRLALDACRQGFDAAILQTDQPADLLKQLVAAEIRVILNHRLDRHSACGHYSALVRFDGQTIELHDPQRGPGTILSWSEFAECWAPTERPSETAGNALIAIGRRPSKVEPCSVCGWTPPTQLPCPRCGQVAPVGAAGRLGCGRAACGGLLWRRRFCPHCDWATPNRGQCETTFSPITP